MLTIAPTACTGADEPSGRSNTVRRCCSNWDYGTKHGDIQVLGAMAYAAPLISTIVLIAFGKGEATWFVAVGCVLIVGGAVLASKELLTRRKRV